MLSTWYQMHLCMKISYFITREKGSSVIAITINSNWKISPYYYCFGWGVNYQIARISVSNGASIRRSADRRQWSSTCDFWVSNANADEFLRLVFALFAPHSNLTWIFHPESCSLFLHWWVSKSLLRGEVTRCSQERKWYPNILNWSHWARIVKQLVFTSGNGHRVGKNEGIRR